MVAKKKTESAVKPKQVAPLDDGEQIDLTLVHAKTMELLQLYEGMGQSDEMAQARIRLKESAMWAVHHVTGAAIRRSGPSRGPSDLMSTLIDVVDHRTGVLEHRVAELEALVESAKEALTSNRELAQLFEDGLRDLGVPLEVDGEHSPTLAALDWIAAHQAEEATSK